MGATYSPSALVSWNGGQQPSDLLTRIQNSLSAVGTANFTGMALGDLSLPPPRFPIHGHRMGWRGMGFRGLGQMDMTDLTPVYTDPTTMIDTTGITTPVAGTWTPEGPGSYPQTTPTPTVNATGQVPTATWLQNLANMWGTAGAKIAMAQGGVLQPTYTAMGPGGAVTVYGSGTQATAGMTPLTTGSGMIWILLIGGVVVVAMMAGKK
jgi:hypothetical protein